MKHLNSEIEDLKEKFEDNKLNEVREIIEAQRVIDEIVVTNSDAIKQIKTEIMQLKSEKQVNLSSSTNNQ